MKYSFVIFIIVFFSGFSYAQKKKQYNTNGSDLAADIPSVVYKNGNNSIQDGLPVSFYIFGSDCFGCNNELAYIDIKIKSAGSNTFDSLLHFSDFSDSDFLSLFQDVSTGDALFDVQDFYDALPAKKNNHTIIFTADTNFWIPPVPIVDITKKYFYFSFLVPYSKISSMGNCFDVEVTFGLDFEADIIQYFRVFLTEESMPSMEEWYRGDTHYHGMYTQNTAEYGLPLAMTKFAAKKAQLDWLTFTDHSCDFDNYGASMQANWERLGTEISNLNNADSSCVLIRGIELSILNSNAKVVHALAFPPPDAPFALPFIADGGGDLSSTQVSISMILDSLNKYNGFGYAAHPFAEMDALSSVINGSCWNLGDSIFPANGNNHSCGGTIISNSVTLNSDIFADTGNVLFHPCLIGGQLWNLYNTLSTTDDVLNPWNVLNVQGNLGFQPLSVYDPMHNDFRFQQNLDVYKAILKKGLRSKNLFPGIASWKFFMCAGTDAHGSFNYSNTDMTGAVIGNINDNALGKLSTLVHCPEGMGPHGQNVLAALKNGHTILSSGPLIVMQVETSDGTKYFSGDDADLSLYSGEITIRCNVITNDDFGLVASIKLFIGTESGEQEISLPVFGGEQEFFLSEILLQHNCALEPGKYFYLRSELQTVKVYTYPQSVYYKKSHEFFKAFTNPVWFKAGIITSIPAQSCDDVVLFPNPANDFLHINSRLGEKIEKWEIMDMYGKLLSKEEIMSLENIIIDVHNLLPSNYIIKIYTRKGMIAQKFCKL